MTLLATVWILLQIHLSRPVDQGMRDSHIAIWGFHIDISTVITRQEIPFSLQVPGPSPRHSGLDPNPCFFQVENCIICYHFSPYQHLLPLGFTNCDAYSLIL